jgi:hypothetical protein
MARKSQTKKTSYQTIDVRGTAAEIAEITQAAELDAVTRGIPYSRNHFALRNLLAAARTIARKVNSR